MCYIFAGWNKDATRGSWPLLLGANTLLGAPGLTTGANTLLGAPGLTTSLLPLLGASTLLGAPGIATRNKNATIVSGRRDDRRNTEYLAGESGRTCQCAAYVLDVATPSRCKTGGKGQSKEDRRQWFAERTARASAGWVTPARSRQRCGIIDYLAQGRLPYY